MILCELEGNLVPNKRHQRHKAGSFDGIGYGVLADCSTAGLTTGNQTTMSIDQFFEQLDVLIVNIHRSWTFAINVQWILANRFDFDLWFLTNEFFLKLCQANNPLTQNVIDTNAADNSITS